MRSFTVFVALAAVSAAALTLALPVSISYAFRASSETTCDDVSDVIHQLLARQNADKTRAINLGRTANIAGIGSTVVGVLSSLYHGWVLIPCDGCYDSDS
jgi:hypothetical protein